MPHLQNQTKRKINFRQVAVDDERLAPEPKELEYIFLQLRTREGISFADYRKLFGKDFLSSHKSTIQKLSGHPDAPFFAVENDRFYLTPTGFVLFDEICGICVAGCSPLYFSCRIKKPFFSIILKKTLHLENLMRILKPSINCTLSFCFMIIVNLIVLQLAFTSQSNRGK